MSYSIIVVTDSIWEKNVIQEHINAHSETYQLIFYTFNAFEILSIISNFSPQIIIIKDSISFYDVNHFISELYPKRPLIQYVLVRKSREINTIKPEIMELISATLFEDELSGENPSAPLEQALRRAAVNYEARASGRTDAQCLAKQRRQADSTVDFFHRNKAFRSALRGAGGLPRLEQSGGCILLTGSSRDGPFISFSNSEQCLELVQRLISLIHEFCEGAVYIPAEDTLCILLMKMEYLRNSEHLPEEITRLCAMINQVLKMLQLPPLRYAFSKTFWTQEALPTIYVSTKQLLRLHFFNEDQLAISKDWLLSRNRLFPKNQYDTYIAELGQCLYGLDTARLLHTFEHIFELVRESYSFEEYNYAVSHLIVLISEQISKNSLPAEMYLGFAGHQPPSLLEMFGSLRESLVRLFHALPHNLPSSSNQHIQSAINYMSAHIGENPKLAHVAEEIHINPSYLSRLFQKEFNQTFTDICNEMAIRHAMGLISGGGENQ